MLLVVDIGNTRAKWAYVNADDSLQEMQACANTGIATSVSLKESFAGVTKVLVSNVAGDDAAQALQKIIPKDVDTFFVTPQARACSVINHYQVDALGIDRWAALIATWHMNKQPSIVVNAGTAITIDALAKNKTAIGGVFKGGTIMPGLSLMLDSLDNNTAQLNSNATGQVVSFPTNTQDAMQTGCMNAIVGEIVLALKRLEKHSAFLPKLVLSGGDANKIAEALKPQVKRVMIVENLVLQGLVLLEKETV